MKYLLVLLLPFSVFASNFSQKYHGTYEGTFKKHLFAEKEKCYLNISYSHTNNLGGIEIKYHAFDFHFNTEELLIDGSEITNDEIDNQLSENWFMADFPHRLFEFTKRFEGEYLTTALRFRSEKLRSFQLYLKSGRAGSGGIVSPGLIRGVLCKNLQKVN